MCRVHPFGYLTKKKKKKKKETTADCNRKSVECQRLSRGVSISEEKLEKLFSQRLLVIFVNYFLSISYIRDHDFDAYIRDD